MNLKLSTWKSTSWKQIS